MYFKRQILSPRPLCYPPARTRPINPLPACLVDSGNLSIKRLETELVLLSAITFDRDLLATSQTLT